MYRPPILRSWSNSLERYISLCGLLIIMIILKTSGARKGIRTLTTYHGNRSLKPACLPVPPSSHLDVTTIIIRIYGEIKQIVQFIRIFYKIKFYGLNSSLFFLLRSITNCATAFFKSFKFPLLCSTISARASF